MKSIFSTLIAAVLMLLPPQLADACMGTKPWTPQDIAFADMIFEGSITNLEEGPVSKELGRPLFLKFTFDVNRVVRGKLNQDEIVVGWIPKSYGISPKRSLVDIQKHIGDTTRVAITTPQFANKFCEFKLRQGSYYDEKSGELVSGKRVQPVCEASAKSLEPAIRENMPFVLSNGYTCGRSYLFPVQRYEDMQNYEKNYAAYKAALDKARKEARATKEGRAAFQARGAAEFYREMVPEEPLMWKVPQPTAGNYAVNLVRDYKIFFTPALKDNAALQEAVLDLGIAIARYDIPRAQWNRPAWFDRDEAMRADFREDLRREILRLVSYMEKDPNFRTRLLLDD